MSLLYVYMRLITEGSTDTTNLLHSNLHLFIQRDVTLNILIEETQLLTIEYCLKQSSKLQQSQVKLLHIALSRNLQMKPLKLERTEHSTQFALSQTSYKNQKQ